jgi:hypothetical protein
LLTQVWDISSADFIYLPLFTPINSLGGLEASGKRVTQVLAEQIFILHQGFSKVFFSTKGDVRATEL